MIDIKWYTDFLIEELTEQRNVILKQISNLPLYPISDDNLNRIKTLIIKQAQLGHTIESLRPLANRFITDNNLPFTKYVL
jgi:hypothetical protein